MIRVCALAALAWGAVYLIWRAVDTWRGAQPEMFGVLYAGELFGWVMLLSFAFLAWRVPVSARPPIGWRPSVDVYVCTYDEGLDVLGATLVGCDRIAYPHTTWVLDDGSREQVRTLATRFGANYLTRSTNEHAKAGNINHALEHTTGQLILVLDADHVPQPDILDATVGYFDDPSVALVQTPHDFGNHDSFQHFETGRHDQSMFFEVIMPGKDRHDGAFWCGSAALILRHALEGIGGIATETVAEDFHTTVRLHGQGWHTRYHDETLVQGLAPHDLATFLLQRDRWARGNLAVLRTPENPVVAANLTVKQRASYLSSLLAYFVPLQRLSMVAVLVAMLVSGRLPLHATLWQFCVFWLPWMALNLLASSVLCRGRASLWDGSYSTLLTTEIFTRAAFVLIHPFRTSFNVTPKDGIDDGGWQAARQLRLVLAMAAVIVAAVVLRGLALAGIAPLPPLPGLAVVAGLAFAAWELVMVTAALDQGDPPPPGPPPLPGPGGGGRRRRRIAGPGGRPDTGRGRGDRARRLRGGHRGRPPPRPALGVRGRAHGPGQVHHLLLPHGQGPRVADGRHADTVDRGRRRGTHRALSRGQLPNPVGRVGSPDPWPAGSGRCRVRRRPPGAPGPGPRLTTVPGLLGASGVVVSPGVGASRGGGRGSGPA